MNKLFVSVLLGLCSAGANAQPQYSNDPHSPYAGPDVVFDAKENKRTIMMTISWITLDDPQDMCQRVSGRLFPYAIEGCANYIASENRCVIITHHKTTMHTLGHELRHCYQGSWHDEPKNAKAK